MRYALVSDIHANLQAWLAVLDDIRQTGADTVVCLGDVIGYGPRPREVLDSVREHASAMLLGNHEAAICGRFDVACFSDEARRLIEWTDAQLGEDDRREFGALPMTVEFESFVASHSGFVEPEAFDYIEQESDALAHLNVVSRAVAFVGHTHIPGCFTLRAGATRAAFTRAIDGVADPAARVMVNVGSVGELRTGEAVATYCLYDTATRAITCRRLPFDVAGYRDDLRRQRIGRKPYFLQCLDGEAEAGSPAVQRALMLQRGAERRAARREALRCALAARRSQAVEAAAAERARAATNRQVLESAVQSTAEARMAREARLAAERAARGARLLQLQAAAEVKRREEEERRKAANRALLRAAQAAERKRSRQ